MLTRRDFLAASAAATSSALLPRLAAAEPTDVFKISLAQWSLNRAFFMENPPPDQSLVN